MGSDPMAIVDAQLCVHGLAGLRVADASIMPTLTSGSTNAPSIMIGEKAADMMLMPREGQCLPAWVRRDAHWQGRAASTVCKKRSCRIVED